jgi:hypothetical protein
MSLSLPAPDLATAFQARLLRLSRALATELENDADLLLLLPQSAPEEHARWVERMKGERAERPHLTSAWQAITLQPGVRAPALPWTVRTGLELLVGGLDAMAKELADEVVFCVDRIVDKKLRAAVSARMEIVQYWPRPRMETGAAACALHALTSTLRALPEDEHPPSHLVGYTENDHPVVFYYWPPKAALADVAEWAHKGLNLLGGLGDGFREPALRGKVPQDVLLPHEGRTYRLPAAGLAVLYLAERDVREGSRRPAIAIDAGKVHHELVGGMRDWPRDGRGHRGRALENVPIRAEDVIERVELLAEGNTVQLHLPMPAFMGMQDHAIEALRVLRGAKGLRHWAALLRLFSVEGGRSGTYRWLLNEHLAAMGYDERQVRDPAVRADAAREVEALASLELAIYTSGGVLRERRRLLLETGRFERRVGAEYKLDGIEFQMNQKVFSGVRASTGEIGQKWMPAPVELARIDHVRHPFAHALGMLLAIRFRWRLEEHGDHLALSGENLLRLAGIPFERARAARAWARLRRELNVLVKAGQLARYGWNNDEDAWSFTGICRIYSSEWILDRAARGVLPEERPQDKSKPVTGAELKTWREGRGWSQRETARRLKVTAMAISKAEGKPEDALGHKLRAAFERGSSEELVAGRV